MSTTIAGAAPARPPRSAWATAASRFARQPLAMLGLGVVVLFAVVAVAAPVIAPFDPNAQDIPNRLQQPGPQHWFGTDELGRDLLSRMLYATQIALVAPLVAVGLALAAGLPTGLLAGYRGGRVDWVCSRVADTLLSLPDLVLAIAVIAVLGPSTVNAMIAIGVVYFPRLYRVSRAATIAIRQETYVEALRSLGFSQRRILWTHVLPNALSPIVVQVSLLMGFALLVEAGLSFLGLGVQPPEASWGVIARRGFQFVYDAPYYILIPGAAISVLVLAFALIGDGIRDSLGRETRS